MRILFLTDRAFVMPPEQRGGARFLVNICRELGLRGVNIDVLTMINDRINVATDEPYKIISCKESKYISSRGLIFKTLSLFKNRYDIFFMGIMLTTGAMGMFFLSRLLRIPFVMLIHGFDLDYLRSRFFLDRFFSSLYIKNAELILVNSSATGQKAELNGADPKKIKVLNPGVNTKLFCRKTDVKYYREKHNLDNKRVVLTVSRLVKRKGHRFVIEAVAELQKTFPDLHYLIIGEGPERETLDQLVIDLGLSDKVSFIGAVSENALPYYYSLSEVFVMPTISDGYDYEGFGMVYLESNACGVPVIGSKSGGVGDAIADEETGFLVDEKDTSGIVGAIKTLLKDDVLRARMGETGRKRAEKFFSWEEVGYKLEGYLKECYE